MPPPPLCPCGKKHAVLWDMKNTPNLASHTGSENRVARNSVSCFGSSRRRESRPLLGRSGDNLTLLQERVRASIVRVSQKLAAYDKVMK